MSNTFSNVAARLNATRVTADGLLLASSEVHKLPLEDRGWEDRLHLMARLFKGEPEKGLAIEYRLMAMSTLVASGTLPHWALPEAPNGSVHIAEPVWLAAATEPVLFKEQKAFFEPKCFLKCVLSLAESDGHA
ncbi:MAG: hypothetical protein ACYCXX_14750 [Acidiferrobacter thiooxydans]